VIPWFIYLAVMSFVGQEVMETVWRVKNFVEIWFDNLSLMSYGEGLPVRTYAKVADSGRPRLCSTDANVLTVPRTNTQLGEKNRTRTDSRSWFWEFGTVYLPHCGSLTLNLDTLNDFWRHFCLARPRRISGTNCNAPCISWFTYLLTLVSHKMNDTKKL